MILNGEVVINFDFTNPDDNELILNLPDLKNLNKELLIGNEASLLRIIYRGTPTNNDSPVTKIIEFVEKMLWFRCVNEGNRFIGFRADNANMSELIISNNKLIEFEKFLKNNGVNYNLISKKIDNRDEIYVSSGNKEANILTIASTGTKSLMLFFCWSIFFKDVSFLFLDEFDAFYHYESSELVVNMINSCINMQAFVTTHNTYLMKNSITRPDCCFIVSDGKIHSLSDCTDKEIREAHNLEKMYRNGAFTEE